MQGLADAAHKILDPAWASGVPDKIKTAHEEFLAEFRKPGFPPSKYLRAGVTLEDLLQWFYEVDHINLSYGLKYNGVELEKLSQARRGLSS